MVLYSTIKPEDTEALGRQRAKPSKIKARYSLSQPTCKNCSYLVHHYNSTQYCNTETVFIYIPLPPDPTGNIKFTYEEEEDKQIPFLDTLLVRWVSETSGI